MDVVSDEEKLCDSGFGRHFGLAKLLPADPKKGRRSGAEVAEGGLFAEA